MTNTNPRTSAYQGEYVRLYCSFAIDGIPSDPNTPVVYIYSNATYLESSSSSSNESSTYGGTYGPYQATKEVTGLWYIDWLVPDALPTGDWYDAWSYSWQGQSTATQQVFAFTVHSADEWIRYDAPPGVEKISATSVELIRVMNSIAIRDAQNIVVESEQGKRDPNAKKMTFAFQNWNEYPRPLVIKNRRLFDSGWQVDYNGNLQFMRNLDPEDVVNCSYSFRYFATPELLDMLNYGLYMMNATPPVSENYASVASAPYSWRGPILACAGMVAMQRLVLGLSWQHRKIIYGEDPQVSDSAMAKFQSLYEMFKTQFEAGAKGVKTQKWPGMAQIVQPEFTLPGGRSRWFRYLFKS